VKKTLNGENKQTNSHLPRRSTNKFSASKVHVKRPTENAQKRNASTEILIDYKQVCVRLFAEKQLLECELRTERIARIQALEELQVGMTSRQMGKFLPCATPILRRGDAGEERLSTSLFPLSSPAYSRPNVPMGGFALGVKQEQFPI